MKLNCTQSNLVEVDKQTYRKIEKKIELDYFLKQIGPSWYSANSKFSALRKKDGTIIIIEEIYISENNENKTIFKVDSEILNAYQKTLS